MASKAVRYTPEFKRQMVDLVRSGRTPASLAKEFGPTSWSISLWVKQDERDTGKGDGGLTSTEREELSRLRRENRKLKEEREILSKAAAWLCVQRRQRHSAGNRPAGEIVRNPVAGIAEWRRLRLRSLSTSHRKDGRELSGCNEGECEVTSKTVESGSRARNQGAKAA